MKYGILFANTMDFAGLDGSAELGRVAEEVGFESLWTVEHVIYPDGYESEYPYDRSGRMAGDSSTPIPDPLIWLSFVAARTTTLRLATGILILPQRNPLVLAKEVATLDALSGGRLELGIGVGWLREEFDALGVPFDGRGARADEYIEIMRTLWSGDNVAHSGALHRFADVSSNPKPARGRVPIHVGGHSRRAAERAGRLGDGFFPGRGNLSELVDIMVQTAADEGRDPAEIEITSSSPGIFGDDPIGAVEELAALGVSRVGVPAFAFRRDPASEMAEFAEKLIRPTRDL